MRLFHGDCLRVMNRLIYEGVKVDMVLCDLPYGVTQHPDDVPIPFGELWKRYDRLVKPDGCIALFGQGLFYVDLVNSNRKGFRYDLIWDKVLPTGFLNANRMPLRVHEQIAIFYKKMPVYNPEFEEGEPLHGKGHAFKMLDPTNQNYGEYDQSEDREGSTLKYPKSIKLYYDPAEHERIISFPKPHPSVALHRTEKSVACCEYLIKMYTNEGDTVLDNCMGCGTTGVACLNTGREFIGIELNSELYDIAKSRLP